MPIFDSFKTQGFQIVVKKMKKKSHFKTNSYITSIGDLNQSKNLVIRDKYVTPAIVINTVFVKKRQIHTNQMICKKS